MKIKFAKEWNSTSQQKQKFYPISITPALIDADRGQRLNATLADLYSVINRLTYKDVYIGTGTNYTQIMIAANHHDLVTRGDKFSLTASNNKVRVVMPSSYTPTLLMNGIQVPISLSNTITVDEIEYKVWATDNTYNGSFDVFMF